MGHINLVQMQRYAAASVEDGHRHPSIQKVVHWDPKVVIPVMRERFGIDDLFEYWEQKARREERTWLALVKLILSRKRLPHPWKRLPHPLVDKICDLLYSEEEAQEEEDQPRIQNGGL